MGMEEGAPGGGVAALGEPLGEELLREGGSSAPQKIETEEKVGKKILFFFRNSVP